MFLVKKCVFVVVVFFCFCCLFFLLFFFLFFFVFVVCFLVCYCFFIFFLSIRLDSNAKGFEAAICIDNCFPNVLTVSEFQIFKLVNVRIFKMSTF